MFGRSILTSPLIKKLIDFENNPPSNPGAPNPLTYLYDHLPPYHDPSPSEPGLPTAPDPFSPPGGDPWGGAGGAIYDPIVLDLNGDGIQTIDVNNGVFFDNDANGFAERTGWVNSNDGLLVIDRNGDNVINNGQELFGDQTVLSNGTRAASGFQALADLDSNSDGKIDINDKAFSQLRVWRDLNGDGYSSADELSTLDQLDIKSFDLNYTSSNRSDENGNIQTRLGSYNKQDGTIMQIGEYQFSRDTIHTIATDLLEVPEIYTSLPDLDGYGNVYNLWQAMVRDESGTLKTLVEAFSSEENPEMRDSIMNQILYKWTNSDAIDPASRGSSIDARQLSVLEKMFGQQFSGLVTWQGTTSNPNINAAAILKDIYADVKEYYYVRLMAQTHMSDLLNDIHFTQDITTNTFVGDLADVQTEIDGYFSQSYDKGIEQLAEFSRVLYGLGLQTSLTNFTDFRNHFANTYGAEVGLTIDSAGKNLKGIINGGDGDDSLFGGAGSNTFYGGSGNDVIYGGAGDDNLFGQKGNDTLIGGSGNDYLEGGTGNDIYQFGVGSGNDRICNYGSTDEYDIVQVADGLTADMLVYLQNGSDLILEIKSSSETLTITNWFNGDSYQVDKVQFADGSELTAAQLSEMAMIRGTMSSENVYGSSRNDKIYGLGGNDTLYGSSSSMVNATMTGNDSLYGGDGNDTLFGQDGDDILDGGTGSDYLYGGAGNDTYIWGQGSGNDTIYNNGAANDNGFDTIKMQNLVLASIEFTRESNDLVCTITQTGETMRLIDWGLGTSYQVGQIQFTDGTLTAADINKKIS